ncbi:FBLN7 protein, partial [Sterrhoptilus dennistouni]|nr:FBLN7 protein [Sterrhoptilus dennistouni]
QECLNWHQALSVVRQMQKLLVAQEAAHLQGTRGLRHQLSILQSRLQRPATKHNEICPQLAVPLNGRMLGRSLRVGHEVHFVCDAGFQLVGSETRACRHNRTLGNALLQLMLMNSLSLGIDDCSSNPCANSGTCVDGNQSYKCLCPPGWSGPSCQSPIYSCSNSSFSRQPRCAEGRSGSRRCSCDTGFQLQPGGVCQDVDECQIYQSSPQMQICLHDCLNLPGSYRCLCPPGYLLHADRNACEDVNECTGKQHNCSQGDLCINTFGGHRCVRPKCPPPRHNTTYVKTSALHMWLHPWPSAGTVAPTQSQPQSVTQSCVPASRGICLAETGMRQRPDDGHTWMRLAWVALPQDRQQGWRCFARHGLGLCTGELLLTSPAAGPATLEVEVEMSEFSHKVLLGKHIFKVTAFVSPYVF